MNSHPVRDRATPWSVSVSICGKPVLSTAPRDVGTIRGDVPEESTPGEVRRRCAHASTTQKTYGYRADCSPPRAPAVVRPYACSVWPSCVHTKPCSGAKTRAAPLVANTVTYFCMSMPQAHSGRVISDEPVASANSSIGGVRKRLAWCALAAQKT